MVWVPKARIQLANDSVTASLILDPETETYSAVGDVLAPLAADVLAADPTIAAAAAAAIDEQVTDLDLVSRGDPGLPVAGEPDAFRVRDKTGAVALEIDGAGTAHVYGELEAGGAVTRKSADDTTTRKRWRIVDANGKIAFEVRETGETFIAAPILGSAGVVTRVVLAVIVGQSNAEGRGMPVSARLDRQHSRCLMAQWTGTNVTGLVPATVPLSSQQTQTGLGIGSIIGKRHVDATDDRTRVVILNAAAGGSGLVATPAQGTWAIDYAGANPHLYTIATTAITATLAQIAAAYPGATVEPWIYWHQGEADSGTAEATYAAALDALFGALRTFLGDATIPIVAGGMVPEYATSAGLLGVRKALIEAQSRLQYVAYTDGIPNGGGSQFVGDTVHYARAAVEQLGTNMYRAGQRAATATSTQIPHKPLVVTATRSGGTVTITWSEPDTRFTAFVVEYRIDSGAWTTAARAIPAEPKQVITGLSGSVIEVRVSSVNAALTSEPTIPVTAIGA